MLDKSIPFYHIVMRRPAGATVPEVCLPEGFSFVTFAPGDEKEWAEIETSAGEFDRAVDALVYFLTNFMPYLDELERRTLFIQNADGAKVATLTDWWGYIGERRVPRVHWVSVRSEYQGLGLGKAIVFEGMRRMLLMEGDTDVFLTTQTWSYQAIGIYMKTGFQLCTEAQVGSFVNEYDQAMRVLKGKLIMPHKTGVIVK